MQTRYKFYATLLDAYQWYRVSERENAKQELIDKINRVPVTDIESIQRMNRGSALNNLIDDIVMLGEILTDSVELNGVTYQFPVKLLSDLADIFEGSTAQYFADMSISSANGSIVDLYGYTDFIKLDTVFDLKTTNSYELGKYKDSMQRHVYPLALMSKGIEINTFEFTCAEIKGKEWNIYRESYQVDMNESMAIIRECVEGLIQFVDSNRDSITDKKIIQLN